MRGSAEWPCWCPSLQPGGQLHQGARAARTQHDAPARSWPALRHSCRRLCVQLHAVRAPPAHPCEPWPRGQEGRHAAGERRRAHPFHAQAAPHGQRAPRERCARFSVPLCCLELAAAARGDAPASGTGRAGCAPPAAPHAHHSAPDPHEHVLRRRPAQPLPAAAAARGSQRRLRRAARCRRRRQPRQPLGAAQRAGGHATGRAHRRGPGLRRRRRRGRRDALPAWHGASLPGAFS